MPQTISDDHYSHVRNMDVIDIASSNQVTNVRLPLHSTQNFEHWARLSWVPWKPIIARKFAYGYSNLISCDTLHHHGAIWESLTQSADVRNCSERLQMYSDLAAHKKRFQCCWVHCHWNWCCKNLQYIIFWNSIISTDFSRSVPHSLFHRLIIWLLHSPFVCLSSFDIFSVPTVFQEKDHSRSQVLKSMSCDGPILQQRVDSILVKFSRSLLRKADSRVCELSRSRKNQRN